ncbi:MAG: glycosyltransferase family 4 protein [Desulfobacterales bacterium]|nr:glycosyltransferase family 4 protein [Desulfobacterales bacterium]
MNLENKKILISAYTCRPNRGSEAILGWNWIIQLATRGAEVFVITREMNKKEIEQHVLKTQIPSNIYFLYYDNYSLLPLLKSFKSKFRYLYYYAWQWGAYKAATKANNKYQFDLVHHVTWVQVRMPSFMGKLGIPFVHGPVGGGESAPIRIRSVLGLKQWLIDLYRECWTLISLADPFVRKTFRQSTRLLVNAPETKRYLPKWAHSKTYQQLAIAYEFRNIEAKPIVQNDNKLNGLKLLFVGRFLGLKGMAIGLSAFSRLLQKYPESKLTLVGKGPAEKQWRRKSAKLEIDKHLEWIDWLPKHEVEKLYSNYDALIFPSLHDSGGFVVLEAMSYGLPVVCLNIGGPGVIVNDHCGIKVNVYNHSKCHIEQALGDGLIRLISEIGLLQQLSRGALERVRDFGWDNLISKCYEGIL